MTYSTETKLINVFCVVAAAGFIGTVLLAVLGVVSYFMAG